MNNLNLLTSPQKAARYAGVLYLLIAFVGVFAIAYVPSQTIQTGDATGTLAKLMDNQNLFRAGIIADMLVILAEIALTAILYFLLRPISPIVSLIAAFARFGMVVVMLANLLLNITAFLMAKAAIFGNAETILALFNIHAMGVYLWGILFGLHLLALGWLIYRSGYFPRFLGLALLLGSAGYILEGLTKITAVEIAGMSAIIIGLLVIVTVAEISFAIWLLVKGVNMDKWQALQIS